MAKNRSDNFSIICLSSDGSGKARSLNVGKKFILFFSAFIFMCVFLVPVLHIHLAALKEQFERLETEKSMVVKELEELYYLKNRLTAIEQKEQQLKEYFGLRDYDSLNVFSGIGGIPDLTEYSSSEFIPELQNEDTPLPVKLENLDTNLSILRQLLETHDNVLNCTPSIIPVEDKNCRISSEFGWRSSPFTGRKEFHAGIDISGSTGTKIVAPADGLLLRTGQDRIMGKYIVIEHTKDIKTIYGHLSKVIANEGERVKRGDTIGAMGNTGLSTGSHLHYAVIENDRCVNPCEFILDRGHK